MMRELFNLSLLLSVSGSALAHHTANGTIESVIEQGLPLLCIASLTVFIVTCKRIKRR